MRKTIYTGVSTAAIVAMSIAVSAQTPQGQSPSQEPSARGAAAQQVTITGCVQSESDYRQAKSLGKGGAAATGVGTGNEFVIIAATASGAGAKGAAAEPTGTTGTATEYEATGSGEGQLKQHVGKRVEITGTVKPAEKAGAKPTGGADPIGQDLRLPEIEIASVRAATSGDCPPAK